eukprot:scaffold993_cov393-Prasinococcus_capsulatus_cf.AAC.7
MQHTLPRGGSGRRARGRPVPLERQQRAVASCGQATAPWARWEHRWRPAPRAGGWPGIRGVRIDMRIDLLGGVEGARKMPGAQALLLDCAPPVTREKWPPGLRCALPVSLRGAPASHAARPTRVPWGISRIGKPALARYVRDFRATCWPSERRYLVNVNIGGNGVPNGAIPAVTALARLESGHSARLDN